MTTQYKYSHKNVQAMATKSLLAIYNELTGKNTSKFATRIAGEKAVIKELIAADRYLEEDDIVADAPNPFSTAIANVSRVRTALTMGECPFCGSHNVIRAGAEGTIAGEQRNYCEDCEKEYWNASGVEYKRRRPGKDVSKKVRKTWADPGVRAARIVKSKVEVNGVVYRSVREAFRELDLPDSKHIAFRMKLRAEGSLTYDGRLTFKILKGA